MKDRSGAVEAAMKDRSVAVEAAMKDRSGVWRRP